MHHTTHPPQSNGQAAGLAPRLTLDDVLAMLDGVSKCGGQHTARCPAHEDRNASLSIAQGDDGRILLHCHAGCEFGEVLSAMGIAASQLRPERNNRNGSAHIVATYDYTDENGALLFQKVRYHPKTFRVRRPNGTGGWKWSIGDARRVLYRLPELLQTAPGTVFVVEGEKDADRLASLGFTTTTNFDGAGKWATTSEYTEPFRGREVVIIPDNDPPGRAHAADVARKLYGIAAEIRVAELPNLPPKGDVSDWLDAGHTADELHELVEHTPAWTPEADTAVATITATPRREPLQKGTMVRPTDRDNFGTVVDDNGDTVTVHFISPDGQTADVDFPPSQLRFADGRPVDPTAVKPFILDLIDSATFAATQYARHFLVKGLLVAGQPCVIGGSQKTLKTSIAADLALSLGTATPFLNRFDVPAAVRVLMISGESGAFTLQETARRIAQAHGRLLSDAQIWWGFRLPQLGVVEHLQVLTEAVREHGIQVAIIDPAYLSMLRTSEGQTINFANVFEVGSVLAQVSEAFAAAGCTPIILHHESKGAGNLRRANGNSPMELQDLSQSGFAEWARQWLLISRRETYEAGTGLHRLWLNVGGSAGHGGLWAVDVNEGMQNDDFTGRQWRVTVESSAALKSQANEATLIEFGKKRERVLAVLREHPEGLSKSQIRDKSGQSGKTFDRLWESLEDAIEPCEIVKANNRKFDAWRLKV